MARGKAPALTVEPRDPDGSRSARRLRREGLVPGVVYGGGKDPLTFSVDARELRLALAHAGAVLDLKLDGDSTPVILKDLQSDPVRGEAVHVDLLRVRLDRPIQSPVPLELVGAEESPGAKEGGVIEHVTREVLVEALPTEIPDVIELDVSGLEINDTLTLAAVQVPEGVTFLDDLEETVVATCTPPRLVIEEEEIEEETELVGEDGEPIPPAEGEGEAAEGGEGGDSGGDGGEE